MLNSKGFDLWADGYDVSVDMSERDNRYPFAGYSQVLEEIYQSIRAKAGTKVLDIGFGTGILTGKLYQDGCEITGIDFSERMIEIAREKMPNARLFCHDFSLGLPDSLKEERFHAIISTYAVHHLTENEKLVFLRELQDHLLPDGVIYVGDVAFETRKDLEACQESCGEEWDEEEIYIVAQELLTEIPNGRFRGISCCAGILEIGAAE